MIRNVVLHLPNEQPLLADLFELPTAGDINLRCTNLRTLDGKRPIFVDDSWSVFVFPYVFIRFVEVPPAAVAGTELADQMPVPAAAGAGRNGTSAAPLEALEEGELEIDEDFLRRIREV